MHKRAEEIVFYACRRNFIHYNGDTNTSTCQKKLALTITTIYGENERDRLRETLAFLTAFSRAGLGEGERLLL